jgi:hypothetical protein
VGSDNRNTLYGLATPISGIKLYENPFFIVSKERFFSKMERKDNHLLAFAK